MISDTNSCWWKGYIFPWSNKHLFCSFPLPFLSAKLPIDSPHCLIVPTSWFNHNTTNTWLHLWPFYLSTYIDQSLSGLLWAGVLWQWKISANMMPVKRVFLLISYSIFHMAEVWYRIVVTPVHYGLGGIVTHGAINHHTSGAWWHHNLKKFSTLLALYTGNPAVTSGFPRTNVCHSPHKWPVMWSFDFSIKKLLNKQSSCQWLVMPWHWCGITHCNG